MATSPYKARAIVLDASFIVAICAVETNRYAKAFALLQVEAAIGSNFFSPGVAIAESLFALARKRDDGTLDAARHSTAVKALDAIMKPVLPPPNGDKSLIIRAESLRMGYDRKHSADSIYLALAEDLQGAWTTEIVTFDKEMKEQAAKNAPSLTVNLLST
jgi:predicted nucleic acid-binding protein